MRIEIHHTYRGCECGCCGHQIEVHSEDGGYYVYFEAGHPDDNDYVKYARDIVGQFLKYHHPELLPKVDWSAMVVDVASLDSCQL